MSTSLLTPSPSAVPRATQADALLQSRARAFGDGRRLHAGADGVPTLLCASGRGGSGTSLVAALLAVAAAGEGARVLLVDADEHVGPLSMLLGVTARASWLDLRGARVAPRDVVTPISTTLALVAGGAARMGAAPSTSLTAAERRACMVRVHSLAQGMDVVVVDCGARFDAVTASLQPHRGEQLLAIAAGADPIGLAATFALCKAVHARQRALPLHVLVNRQDGSDAMRCFDAIDAGAKQFLGTALHYAGAIPTDPTLETREFAL